LVKTGVDREAQGTDLMEIRRPDGLGDIANLGLTLSEAKLVLPNVQREIATAQARDHVVRQPDCPGCDGVCRMKDYRDHAVATLFGQVTIKLPRFRCARCGGTETGIGWPLQCRSTPELDRIRADRGMSETVISLDALGVLMRRMQGDIRAIDVKLDLLQRGRERDVASAATREDLRDVVTVLAEHRAGFDQRITGLVGQVVEHMQSTDKTLAEILARLPPA
jgi:hypothetical protein